MFVLMFNHVAMFSQTKAIHFHLPVPIPVTWLKVNKDIVVALALRFKTSSKNLTLSKLQLEQFRKGKGKIVTFCGPLRPPFWISCFVNIWILTMTWTTWNGSGRPWGRRADSYQRTWTMSRPAFKLGVDYHQQNDRNYHQLSYILTVYICIM